MSKIFWENEGAVLYNGDCVEIMKTFNSGSVNKIITSPPYNILRPKLADRGYDVYKDGMSNEEYIKWTLDVFNEYDRILAKDGCVCYNMSYGTENTEVMNLTVAEILKNTPFTLADVLVWKKAPPRRTICRQIK